MRSNEEIQQDSGSRAGGESISRLSALREASPSRRLQLGQCVLRLRGTASVAETYIRLYIICDIYYMHVCICIYGLYY